MPVTRPQAAQRRAGYKLRLRAWNRWIRTAVLGLCIVVFVDGVVGSHGDTTWRVLSVVGLAFSLWGLRVLHGPAVVVDGDHLRIQHRWPVKRDVPWYRILEVDVIPGSWHLDLELNSGEQLALPCVEHVDELYEQIERHRNALGS